MILSKAEITKINDVLVTKYVNNVTITREDAVTIDNAHLTMAANQDMFVLVDVTESGIQFENEAKDFFLHEGKMMPFTKLVAIVGEIKGRSMVHKLLRKSRTYYDVKKFDTVEDAMAWFDQIRRTEKKAS